MIVNDFLPKLKANKHTYYNLSQLDVKNFKHLYSYLKKRKDYKVSSITEKLINNTLNNEKLYFDYIKKYKCLEILTYNIVN